MRSALDKLISGAGFLLVVVLLVAGGLLSWASVFIGDQVHDQLAMQGITMPAKDALETAAQHAALDQYAGQELTTGPQAKAFADSYILVHMNSASDGRTYEEVSGEFIALSDEAKAGAEGQALGGLRQTLFMGNTLRGLLLYGYAFATMGTIALYAAIASFIGAAVLLVLSLLGLRHARTSTSVATTTRAVPATV
ncbi:MAG: hypothetical protein ABIR82_10070 [Nocardioides sp.]